MLTWKVLSHHFLCLLIRIKENWFIVKWKLLGDEEGEVFLQVISKVLQHPLVSPVFVIVNNAQAGYPRHHLEIEVALWLWQAYLICKDE